MAYLHTLLSFRLPSLDEIYVRDSDVAASDIKSELSRLVPFLVDQKSTIRYTTTREAYTSTWEQIGADRVSSHFLRLASAPHSYFQEQAPGIEILVRLLNSLLPLVHPPITTDPPRIHLALSDLYHLFARPKVGPASKKVLFYVAALRQLDRQDWLGMERELRKEVEKLEAELGEEGSESEQPSRDHLLL